MIRYKDKKGERKLKMNTEQSKETIKGERQLIKNALEFLGDAGTYGYILHRRKSKGMYRWIISLCPNPTSKDIPVEQIRDALRLMHIDTPITIPMIITYDCLHLTRSGKYTARMYV